MPLYFCKSVPPSGNYITGLKAFVGGYAGTSYHAEIDIESGIAEYIVLDYGYEQASKEKIVLSEEKIKKLLDSLEEADIFQWDKHYEDKDILDGTVWSVEITLKDSVLQFAGNNAFPDQWEVFCSSLQEVLGKKFA